MKTRNLPLISVVLATHNSRRTIEKCLQSIKRQTYPNVETIVVDSYNYDLKEQKKCKILIQLYAKYFQDGPERSIQRNRGIKEARGDYILVIDQDMYLSPRIIGECYETIRQKNYIALLIPEISIGKGFWAKCIALERHITIYLEEGLNECVRFFKKKDALTIGCYDPTIVGAEDSDFHYKMAKKGKIGKIKSSIKHDEGKVRLWNRIYKKYYYSRAFKEYFRRRPMIAFNQFFPIKKAYFKHWMLLIRHPLLTFGIIVFRIGEVLAGSVGLLLSKNKYGA